MCYKRADVIGAIHYATANDYPDSLANPDAKHSDNPKTFYNSPSSSSEPASFSSSESIQRGGIGILSIRL